MNLLALVTAGGLVAHAIAVVSMGVGALAEHLANRCADRLGR